MRSWSAGGGSPSATPRRSSGSPIGKRHTTPPTSTRTWQSYCVRLAPDAPIGRTELMRRPLHRNRHSPRVMAIHEEAAYSDERTVAHRLPHTEAATRDTLMLPLFPDLSEEQQDYVLDRLAACVLALAA